jgi:drug/metabolite transporter (DMT)-like permease
MAAGARPFLALLVGLLAVSLAAPFILLSHIGAFALPAWRLLSVAVILLPLALPRLRADLAALTPGERWRLLLSGVLYGAHFAAFTGAFDYTTKESAVMLLAGQPLLGAVVGALFLGERITAGMIGASVVAIAGLAVFVQHDVSLEPRALVGDGLVLLCGLLIVACYAMGRRLRARMGLATYLLALYVGGGATCLAAALVAGDPLWGYAPAQWFWLGAAVVVSTLVGHSAFHYAVKFVPVFHVNLTILGEPAIALVVMAALSERYPEFSASRLDLQQGVGGALLLLGVFLGLWWGRDRVGAPTTA